MLWEGVELYLFHRCIRNKKVGKSQRFSGMVFWVKGNKTTGGAPMHLRVNIRSILSFLCRYTILRFSFHFNLTFALPILIIIVIVHLDYIQLFCYRSFKIKIVALISDTNFWNYNFYAIWRLLKKNVLDFLLLFSLVCSSFCHSISLLSECRFNKSNFFFTNASLLWTICPCNTNRKW